MAIIPKVPGGIAAPIAKTAEAAGVVAVPIAKTAEAVGVVAVPIAKTAKAAGTIAVPIAKTAEAVGVVAIPIAKTAEAVGVVAIPATLTPVGASAFPRALTPTLNLDFKNGLYAQNGAPKNQSDLITYSRNSNASYLDRFIDANGDWNYFVNTNYVGSVTNLLIYTEQFDNAAWTKSGTVVTANKTKDPIGGLTADKLAAVTTSTFAPFIVQSITSVASSTYTVSVYAKKSEASFVQIFFAAGHVSGDPRVNFDLSAGVIGSQDTNIISASIIPAGNDWYRISATITAVGTALQPDFAIMKSAANTRAQTTAWTAGDGLFIWGAMINAGLKLLPYVKSVATAGVKVQTESLRIGYDQATGQSLGALIESASTNLALRSEQFDDAGWTKNSSAITANNTKAPDNSTSADKLTAGSTATIAPNILTSVTSVAAASYTFSGYVKRSEASFVQILFSTGNVANNPRVNFNLSTGAIGSQDADIGSASIAPVGNDWFRISATVVAVGTTLIPVFHLIKTATDTRLQTNAWTIGDGLFIWGAQVEAQRAPTSYIRTEGSTVSRLADLVSSPTAGNVPNGDVTFYADVASNGNHKTSEYLYRIEAGAQDFSAVFNTSADLLTSNGGAGIIEVVAGGGAGDAFSITNVLNKSTSVIDSYLNGVLTLTADSGSPIYPDISGVIGIGNLSPVATSQLNGYIKKLTIYDKALTAQEIALL
jgi:hypothetical protein